MKPPRKRGPKFKMADQAIMCALARHEAAHGEIVSMTRALRALGISNPDPMVTAEGFRRRVERQWKRLGAHYRHELAQQRPRKEMTLDDAMRAAGMFPGSIMGSLPMSAIFRQAEETHRRIEAAVNASLMGRNIEAITNAMRLGHTFIDPEVASRMLRGIRALR